MSITYSTCFYVIKSKFEPHIYAQWMNNFFSIVNHFNLVLYTDENSYPYIPTHFNNNNIKIIIKPFEQFYTYKYKHFWIKNHTRNMLLNNKTSWELNMLWSEKIWFVKDTIERKIFETDLYGWCDIGYFRNRPNDLHTFSLVNWSNEKQLNKIYQNKIIYACVNNDVNHLSKILNIKNNIGLPLKEIPPTQQSISGGFFILHKNQIHWWAYTYYSKLLLYFENNYLVKDDQIILADCIFSTENADKFTLFRENTTKFDNWFMFQRILSNPLLKKVEQNQNN
jgi:hypothetical protein